MKYIAGALSYSKREQERDEFFIATCMYPYTVWTPAGIYIFPRNSPAALTNSHYDPSSDSPWSERDARV